MKKRILLPILTISALAALFTLSACNSSDGECNHAFESKYSSSESHHWHACGEGCGETADKAAHNFGEPIVSEEGACGEAYKTVQTCKDCGYKKESEAVKDHSFSSGKDYTSDENDHWYACKNGCGETTGKEAHSYGSIVIEKAATCSLEGRGYYLCADCNYKKSVTIPKANHSYTAHGHDQENHWLSCACGAKDQIEAHDWNQVDNGDGTLTLTCKNEACKAVITTPNENHNHVWVDGEIIKAPSCTEVGEQTVNCACGASSTKTLDKTSHSFTYGEYQKDDSYHWHNCVCGEEATSEFKAEHNYNANVSFEGSYKIKTCVCGKEIREQTQDNGYIDPEGWT